MKTLCGDVFGHSVYFMLDASRLRVATPPDFCGARLSCMSIAIYSEASGLDLIHGS